MVCYHESLVSRNIKTVQTYQGYRYEIVSWYVCANCYKCIPLSSYMDYLSQINKTNNKKYKNHHQSRQKISKYFNTFDITLEDDRSKEKID